MKYDCNLLVPHGELHHDVEAGEGKDQMEERVAVDYALGLV